MRQARELPLRRKTLDELLEAEPRFPELVQFIKSLTELRDKEGILPRVLEVRLVLSALVVPYLCYINEN